MDDSNTLFLAQLVIMIMVGFATIRALQWLQRFLSQESVLEARVAARNWPGALSRLAVIAPLAAHLGQRVIRPSPMSRRHLFLAGAPAAFDERQFSVMTWTLALAVSALAAAGLMVASVIGLQISWATGVGVWIGATLLGALLPRLKLHEMATLQRRHFQRAFPSFLDGLALTLESGQNFQTSVQLSAQRLPQANAALQRQLQELLRDIRAGQSKVAALQRFQERLHIPEVTQFVASMTVAERQGVSVSALLRRQSEQLRMSRALAAERHAMKLPVKLLAPLAICIFPCTFLVLAFPIGTRLLHSGLF